MLMTQCYQQTTIEIISASLFACRPRKVMKQEENSNSFLPLEKEDILQAPYPHNDRPRIDPSSFATKARRVLNQSAHCVYQHGQGRGGCIYLGSRQAALAPLQDFQALNITAVVNVTVDVPCRHHPTLQYHQIAVEDVATTDLLCHFEAACRFIHSVVVNNNININNNNAPSSVLVHCQAGSSRSAAIVVAYLVWHCKMTRNEAYVHGKRQRACIYPKDNFWHQLWMWQQEQQQQL